MERAVTDILVKCPVHGILTTRNRFISGNVNVIINGVVVDCPVEGCKAGAAILPGHYRFVGNVVQAFRGIGATRDQISQFKSILERAKSGEISSEAAAKKAEELGSGFSSILKWANDNGMALAILISIITAY